MPTLTTDFIRTSQKVAVYIGLEPAHSLINSSLLLQKSHKLSGFSEWVTKASAAMSPELAAANGVVIDGLHYAVRPTRRWSSFPAYIDYLASADPILLRDQIFDAYNGCGCQLSTAARPNDPELILASVDTYLEYLQAGFPIDHINVDIESAAYALMTDPMEMQRQIVSHLRKLWTQVLEPEWQRNLPMLNACVEAFQQLDLSQMSPLEAAEQILGQEVPEDWRCTLESEKFQRIIFVPSAHLGPYRTVMSSGDTAWLLFGAHLPQGSLVSSPELSRSELLVRLGALADDTRLHILRSLKEQGQLCSQEIIQQLDLSQSAASRHLKQLSATGYLTERRKNGAKCYGLNQKRIQDTVQALSQFLID